MSYPENRFIQVSGFTGGGKAFLGALLEGHEDIFSPPPIGTDCILASVSEYFLYHAWMHRSDWSEWQAVEIKNCFREFRNYEVLSIVRKTSMPLDTQTRAFLPVDFDFYRTDSLVSQALNTRHVKELTPAKLASIFYHAIEAGFADISDKAVERRRFVSSMVPHNWEYFCSDCFVRNFPGSKDLYIDRDFTDSLITDFWGHVLTYCCLSDQPSDELFCDYLEQWLAAGNRDGHIIYRFLRRYEAWRFPDVFMVVNFADMVEDTESCMRKVASWLDIPYDPILGKVTWMKKEFISPKGTMKQRSDITRSAERMRRTTRILKIIENRINVLEPLIHSVIRSREILRFFYDNIRENATAKDVGVAIYGAGHWGTMLVRMLLQDEVNIRMVMDMKIAENTLIPFTPYFIARPSANSLSPQEKAVIPVYVAVSDAAQHSQIAENLARCGWKNIVFPSQTARTLDSVLELNRW